MCSWRCAVHGGLLYKTLFAPRGADVIEFSSVRHFYGIFWVLSESMRHTHHLVLSRNNEVHRDSAHVVFDNIHQKKQISSKCSRHLVS